MQNVLAAPVAAGISATHAARSSQARLLTTLRYRALDAWLTPLPGLGQQVLAKTHLAPAKLHVVPLGIELDKFTVPGPSQLQARQELNLVLPPDAVLLGLIGRFDDGKGQDFVVEALANLHSRYSQLHLLLVGEPTRDKDNSFWETLQVRIQAVGLADVVHIRGFTLRPEVAYRAFDIAIVASTNETYGMVTIEAMATGRPVVAAATGGTLEIVQDGRTGLLFPLRDTTAFEAAIVRLLTTPSLAKQLGEHAQQVACATYAHTRQCSLTEQVLWKLG